MNKRDLIDEARFAAADLVYSVMEHHNYLNLSLEQVFSGRTLSNLDRAFATAVSYGTITRIFTIDAILTKYSTLPLSKVEPYILAILRTAVWQIFWSDSIPDFAVCDESVKLAKKNANQGAASFVNGLLRHLIREKEIVDRDFLQNPKELWLQCSLPRELAGYLKKWFGDTRAASVCKAMNRILHTTARVNTLMTTDLEVMNELEASGCTIAEPSFMDHAFRIRTNGVTLEKLLPFQQGRFVIQDEAAMLVGIVADPKPGQTVVDLCSAPGGKTCHMAELMKNQGQIHACDIHPSRLELVEQNAQKMGITIISCRQMDACNIDTAIFPDGMADVVLADVPCSGLGILGKKPDIRLHMNHEKMIALYPVQKRILEQASKLVKNGGFLVYSTCTVNPAENENRVREFLAENPDQFEPVDFSDLLPEKLLQTDPGILQAARNGMLTLYPDQHGCDGFFIAKMKRKNR